MHALEMVTTPGRLIVKYPTRTGFYQGARSIDVVGHQPASPLLGSQHGSITLDADSPTSHGDRNTVCNEDIERAVTRFV